MHDENDRLDPQSILEKETTTQTPGQETEQPRRRRGFAAMDPKLVSELASRGGKAAQRAGTAHRFNSEEARVAGRKGGQATGAKRRAKSTSN
jgi:general stress protein YciG